MSRLRTGSIAVLLLGILFALISRISPLWSLAKRGDAVVQYATDRQYLCNALINVIRLQHFGTTAQLVVLLPHSFLHLQPPSPTYRIVAALRDRGVEFVTMDLSSTEYVSDDVTYRHSLQKLEILKLPYRRIMYFDNDGLILRGVNHLFDHFSNEETELIMPEAYYVYGRDTQEDTLMSSALMMIRPSVTLYQKAQALARTRGPRDFDMEITSQLFHDPTVHSKILPFRHNLLLSGLFKNHTSYIGNDQEWNAQQEYRDAVYVHFSDAPIPKPWVDDRGASFAQHGPKCPDGSIECDEVRIWREIYNAFRDEMRESCPSPKELDL